jgi:signal transduction histidine kinase
MLTPKAAQCGAMQVLSWPTPWILKIRRGMPLAQRPLHALSRALTRRLLRQESGPSDRRPMAAVLALVLGSTLSIGAFFMVEGLYRAEAQKRFEGSAAQLTGAVSQSLERYIDVVNAVGSFFAATKDVDRWQFFDFARDTLPRFPGVTALTWVPWVPAGEREAYEQRARDDGLFGFHFKDSGSVERAAASPARDVHLPVYYVEPFEGNVDLLGVDLAGRPHDLETLLAVRDSGRVAITRPPAGIGPAVPGFVVVLPIYRTGNVPTSVAERRKELLGFARASIALPDLIATALPGPAAAADLDVYIYDENAAPGARLLAYHPGSRRSRAPSPLAEDQVRDGLFTVTHRSIAGEDWAIVAKPADTYLPANLKLVAWGVFAFGFLVTLWLAQYLTSSHIRTRLIERAVTKRTGELRAANKALQSEIRERERAERKLREAKKRAEIASRAKSDFLAMMSHELRTPLNAVIGFSEILRNEALGPLGNDQYREYVEYIRASGTELLTRINDILELTKIDGDDFSLIVEPVEIEAIVGAVEPIIQEKAAAAGLKLTVELARDLPQLKADPRALKQILLNLLLNAVKFTRAGGRVALDVRADRRGRLVLQVADNGVGIDPEHLSQVLQPFSQADSSLGRKYEGSGLGLALAHKLVKLHGAELYIDSEVGAGTTVTVIFPKDRVLHRASASRVA